MEFAEVDALLDQALQLDGQARLDFLHRLTEPQRDAVVALLKHTDAIDLEHIGSMVAKSVDRLRNGDLEAGPWQLKHELGAGGMGQVFFAIREEDGFTQKAAVKILWSFQATPDFKARFLRERRILAALDHPGLARFLDGGLLADGRPWFAMEFIDGIDIIAHAEALSLEARLALFLDVCDSVEFAHQRLIIHRDIKPQNIVVDLAERSRLLDFGVAGILDDVDDGVNTRASGSPLTLQYASPELVTGALVTVASDIYQLGLLLYEMLAGVPPYQLKELALRDALKIICDQTPQPPSNIRSGVPTDLDSITLAALQKSPRDRYASVTALATDVRLFLEGRPVAARPPSTWYVTRRFLRRNALVASIAAFSVIGLAAATAISINMAVQAEAEARRSQTSQRILTDVFQRADPFGTSGGNITLADALTAAQPGIQEQVSNDPRLAWEVNKTLADIFTSLGLPDHEGDAYAAALAAARQLSGDNEAELMLAIAGLGNTLVRNDPDSAVEFFTEQLPATPAKKEAAGAWLSAKYAEVNALTRLRRFEEADTHIESMVGVADRFRIDQPHTRARLSQLLAGKARRAGDLAAADRHWLSAVDHMSRADKPGAHAVMLNNMGIHLGMSGRYEEAQQAFQQSLAVFEKFSPNDPSHGAVMRTYAGLLFRMGKPQAAVDELHNALGILDSDTEVYGRYVALLDLATYTLVTGQTRISLEAAFEGPQLAVGEFGAESEVTSRMVLLFARLLLLGDQGQKATDLLRFVSDNRGGDPAHAALANAALDLGAPGEAKLGLDRIENTRSTDYQQTLIRFSWSVGDQAALAKSVKTFESETNDTEPGLLTAWVALATAPQAEEGMAGESVATAGNLLRENQDPFLDVLAQWRLLSAMEGVASRSGFSIPGDLEQRLVELNEVRARTRHLLSIELRDSSDATLRSLLAGTLGSESPSAGGKGLM